jgi:hypothetical protein
MTSDILDRIKGVLADSRIQELDLIIDTLFGDSPLINGVSRDEPDEILESTQEFFDEQMEAYNIHRRIDCGFRTWHQSPINAIVRICNDEDYGVGEKITRLRAYGKRIVDDWGVSSSAVRQASQYITHCIQSLSKNENPLRWDAWLYLDMHGGEGLQS